MNTKRNSIQWTLAFAALGFLDATAMRFGGHVIVGGALFAICLTFVAVGVRRINRMAL